MTRRRSAAPQPRMTPDGFLPGAQIAREAGQDLAVRFAPASYDATAHTVEAVLSTGAPVTRWGITEVLAVSPEAVDLGRVGLGQVRLLDSHNQYELDAILGMVESVRFEGPALIGRIRFSDTARGQAAEAMVRAGTATGISIGYRVETWTLTQSQPDQGTEIWTATRWELLEVSLVSVPADPLALVRAASPAAPPPPAEENDMKRNAPGAAEPTPAPTPAPTPSQTVQRAADPAPVAPPVAPPAGPDAAAITAAASQRAASILDIGTRAGMSQADISAAMVDATVTVDAFRARAFEALAASQNRASTSAVQTRIVQDEGDVLRRNLSEAIYHGVSLTRAINEVPEGARRYMDHTVAELAAVMLGRNQPRTLAAQIEVLERAFHTTSDFPILLANALNRVLDQVYQVAPQTYRRLARQRNFTDFRAHEVLRPADFPTLQKVLENGEIKMGTVGDAKKESVTVGAYGIQFGISRQALVNDRLGGLNEVLASYGTTVALFEEVVFYSLFAQNSGAGPTMLENARALWHSSNGNLTSSATGAIDVTKLTTGRTAMRKMKRLDGNVMNLSPAILLVAPDRETEAQQITVAVTPTQASNVNPFSGTLQTVVSAQLGALPWYLFADPAVLPCFQYGLLDGFTGPRLKMDEPFGMQGIKVSLEHDFGCGAIDYRGAWQNTGA
ncbi:prohead protease/major capsid protein fusion protein [Prosthecomicrobium hirschii]|uniref:prohead protease/major capsid protein fusion protein n=1 Tax=Prosthecodimorpha hirschii TaxID=665126 RepID=UPI00221FB7C1|nr:prohead protease/major capsid protein fusion protein [Prosthecomicrobium hirschii]MCW1839446.1 HK97 family phage prohead protease [Prosthecomicrobium hirschii]